MAALVAICPRIAASSARCIRRSSGRTAALRAPGTAPRRSRTLTVQARAELDPLRNVENGLTSFFKRYDVMSCGIGALLVTSYCVYVHGQDPFEALGLTFTSTVVALVANELLFSNDSRR